MKSIDFRGSSQGVVRDWDSLTEEELRTPAQEPQRVKSVVTRPAFTYDLGERRHSESIPSRRSSMIHNENFLRANMSPKANAVMGIDIPSSKPKQRKIHSIYQPQNIIGGDLVPSVKPPLDGAALIELPGSKQETILASDDIVKKIETKMEVVEASSPPTSAKGTKPPKLQLPAPKSLDNEIQKLDQVPSLSPLTISPISSHFGSPPKYFSFNRPIESQKELLSMKKQIMNVELPTEIALPDIKDSEQFVLELGSSEEQQTALPAGYLSLSRKKSMPRQKFETTHTVINEPNWSGSSTSLVSDETKIETSSDDQLLDQSVVNSPRQLLDPTPDTQPDTIDQDEEAQDSFLENSNSTDSEDSGSDCEDEEDDEYTSSENILTQLQRLKLELELPTSSKSRIQIMLPERKSSAKKSSPFFKSKNLDTIEYKSKSDFDSSKVKSKHWGWLEKIFTSSNSGSKDSFYPAPITPEGRLPDDKEKSIYAQSHIKLGEFDRPLLEQVLISNLMLYILKFNAQVTLHGRGPQRKKKKGKKRRSKLLTECTPIVEEMKPVRKIPAEPLLKFEEPKRKADDDDDVPLAILQKRT